MVSVAETPSRSACEVTAYLLRVRGLLFLGGTRRLPPLVRGNGSTGHLLASGVGVRLPQKRRLRGLDRLLAYDSLLRIIIVRQGGPEALARSGFPIGAGTKPCPEAGGFAVVGLIRRQQSSDCRGSRGSPALSLVGNGTTAYHSAVGTRDLARQHPADLVAWYWALSLVTFPSAFSPSSRLLRLGATLRGIGVLLARTGGFPALG